MVKYPVGGVKGASHAEHDIQRSESPPTEPAPPRDPEFDGRKSIARIFNVDMGTNVIDLDSGGRRVKERPSNRRQRLLEAFQAGEAEHAACDGVVAAAAAAGHGIELLRVQLVELAREAAALRWDREHASDARERQRLSSRRVRALQAVAAAVIEIHRLEGGGPSPSVLARVLGDLQGVVEGCASELFDHETGERLLTAMRVRLGPMLAEVVSGASRR
jgi:hypothetical protein